MAPAKLVFLAPSAILPGKDAAQPATVEVDLSNGTISAVHSELRDKDAYGSEVEVLSLDKDKVLLPGLIDCHVHLNQPGRTAWEGFQTGTLAAISGGVTTLIDMPLNSIPPSTTIANLNVKRNEARNVGVNCDVGFWGGIIPGNAGDLKGLLEQGVKGFKCFMIESGVDEFPMVTEKDLVEACDALEGTSALILFHAEMGNMDDHTPSDPHSHYSAFLDSRPESLELDALSLILSLCRRYPKLKFHIVHLSASSALPIIRQARSEGVSNLTVETCFHYLTLKAEEIPENATQFKCCPPIRDGKNRKLLLEAVVDGTIDYVVSDHSPCIPELKKGDFMSAWGGISGLGLGLQLLWTELGGKVELGRIVTWLGSTQAKQVGLLGQKGEIKVGAQADFVVFDPNAERTISQDSLQFKNKISPYVGKTLKGVVESTWIRGQKVWDGHNIVKESSGQLL